MKGTKRSGPQACDACGREFLAIAGVVWTCHYCGYDNKAGVELALHAARIGSKNSAEKAKQRRLQREEGKK